jgi:predicted GTPase
MSTATSDGMVLVMGITGSGKSYFVNQLKSGAVVEGDTLESCKSKKHKLYIYTDDLF